LARFLDLGSTVRNVAVVLSGCGHKDGTEITEAVSALIALSELGAKYSCFAPQAYMESSGRISRGEISDITQLKAKDYDAVVFPGGYGAAKNLSNWAEKGSACQVQPEVARVIKEFNEADKPIGAICIAPALVAKVLGSKGINLTIGDNKETAAEIQKTGAHHVACPVTDYVSDRDHKVLTTPAYMYDAKPSEVFTGIRAMIRELVEMA
jgi:enhancing lycopene biosynthesis protein 2